MNDFTRGVWFAVTLMVLGHCVYEAGKADGRRAERRKKIKEIPIVIVNKSKKNEES